MTSGRKGKENKGENSSTNTIGKSTMDDEVLRQRIAEKAYELYEKRGPSHGHDLDDWLAAERLVLSEIKSQTYSKANKSRSRVQRSNVKGKR